MVRTSNPNMVQAQALRVAPSSLQEEIHLFLEGRKISDVYVSQNVRSVQSFSPTDKVYVGSRLGPVPSGYLILRADSPPIYWNTKIGIAHILKLVFDKRQVEKVGSIVLSATYYGNERKMILEDILYYNGALVWSTLTFSERWKIMKNICRFVIKPDTIGIQGFDVSVAKLQSIEEWCKRTEYNNTFMWEFIIDKARTRRLLWRPDSTPVVHPIAGFSSPAFTPSYPNNPQHSSHHVPSSSHHVPSSSPHVPSSSPHILSTSSSLPQQQYTGPLIARIEKDTSLNLPDSYILYAANNVNIGAPSVKKLSISLALRNDVPCSVRVQYNDTFKKYEVVELVDNTQPLSQQAAFDKRT
jgi:hypothetical protein